MNEKNENQLTWQRLLQELIVCSLFVAVATMIVHVLDRISLQPIPFGLDWKSFWSSVQDGSISYKPEIGIYNPPWILLLLLPLGTLSFQASWGLAGFVTLIILVVSVPRTTKTGLWIAAVLLLITSFPSIRHLVDGNVEALLIAGVLLTLYAYHQENPFLLALGILLAMAKPQETWLFGLLMAIVLLSTWPAREWRKTVGLVGLVGVSTMLIWGRPMFRAIGTFQGGRSERDMSILGFLARLQVPSWLIITLWLCLLVGTLYVLLRDKKTLSRDKATFSVIASMLLAPYAAGNSFVSIIAIGIIPLLFCQPRLAVVLLALSNAPYLATPELRRWLEAPYWTIMLFVCWIIFAWRISRSQTIPNVNLNRA